MEGALATVVGGLLAQPIIAVPVSVGWCKNGETALIVFVKLFSWYKLNIDNGYGAAMAAIRIIKVFLNTYFQFLKVFYP